MPKKKTYLDMYLDNSENNKKKKNKGDYFTDVHEQAILKFNNKTTSEKERKHLFDTIIEFGFRDISDRILDMPKFHNLPKGLTREELVEDAYYRLVEKISKFTAKIGKSGKPAKAFSYFSTIAKNYVLERKVRFEKILKNKADVETSIDLYILSEDTLKKMSNYDKTDMVFNDYEDVFGITRDSIVEIIQEVMNAEEKKVKKDVNFIKIGYSLIYLLKNWDKIEFMKKNEFMRILGLYTGLESQHVSMQFKKIKNVVLKSIKNDGVIKLDRKIKDEEDIKEDIDEEDIPKEQKNNRFKYGIHSMEEFEMSLEYAFNDNVKNIKKKKTEDNVK